MHFSRHRVINSATLSTGKVEAIGISKWSTLVLFLICIN